MNRKDYLTGLPGPSFFEHCAFVSVDLQQSGPGEAAQPSPITDAEMPEPWRQMGFTASDVNAASDFAWRHCLPNAVRVAEACRSLKLPMIFIHWGSRYPDMIDIDPEVRQWLYTGKDSRENTYCPERREQPAAALGVRPGEYVLAKTAQDAFTATPLHFMLRNLGVESLVLVGGHTGACLGKTSKTAKVLGYAMLCVEDATNNAFESNRIEKLLECGYDYIITTRQFERLAGGLKSTETQVE